MMVLFNTLLAVWLAASLPMVLTAILGQSFGAVLIEISWGVGPRIVGFRKTVFRLFPLGASIRFRHSATGPADEYGHVAGAMDQLAPWRRVLLALCGPAVCLQLAIILIGPAAITSFAAGFYQIVAGALQPFSTAQDYLASWRLAAQSLPFLSLLALTMAKTTAFNLLPFGGSSTLAALDALADAASVPLALREQVQRWLMLPLLLLAASWTCAIVYFAATKLQA